MESIPGTRVWIYFLGLWVSVSSALPPKFDLRDANGKKYVTTVKSQNGGTCWTHGAMAAIESNLTLTGIWQQAGELGEANLAEYHLDWWNGFNKNFNSDISPSSGGLTVHEGGDYRVAAAYLSRGGGAVRDLDAQSYSYPPKEKNSSYHYYYVRDIEWFDAGPTLSKIGSIKEAIMNHGAIGTALTSSSSFMSSGYVHYQSPSNSLKPNHAVSIVGWDDNKSTQAPQRGAWIVKNSWGTDWGLEGYFYISYYDKVAGHDPQMGAISFQNVEPMAYDHIYYHDYHGWRDTLKTSNEAFNAFTATGKEKMTAVSFYTAENEVGYSIRIYKQFNGIVLSHMVSVQEGVIAHTGFHTVDLNWPVLLNEGEKFYVALKLSHGGQPFDKTSDVPVLLGGGTRTIVTSKANAGESFYLNGEAWLDLTKIEPTGNFCIKALTIKQ